MWSWTGQQARRGPERRGGLRVIDCNLTRLSRLLRILRFHAHDLKLVPSVTAYMRWGKGPKQRVRFTKTGDPRLEEAYATHFVWPGKGPFQPAASNKKHARGVDTEQEVGPAQPSAGERRMSKRKKGTRSMKKKPSKVTKLPDRRAPPSKQDLDRKLSEIIKEMAMRLLRKPNAPTSGPAKAAVLMLAGAAWNSAIGDNVMRGQHRKLVEQIDWSGVTPWSELRSDDTEQLIAELVEYKRDHYPDDLRRVVGTEMTPQGNVRVHWAEPEKVATAELGATSIKAKTTKTKPGHPIADQLVKKMNRYVRAKVVDLTAFMAGRAHAEELQKTVVTPEKLADYHPAHAIYVYAQNQTSVMSEQLTELKEMGPFDKLISKAEDEYMPGGPPMSPLTASFFTCWAFFDACVGPAEETIGTTTMAVGAAYGMHEELVRVIGLMQESRMGVYAHEGVEKDTVVLRELVTDRVCRAIVPAGYRGRKGELWYVRVLPPALPGFTEHVVFTTPYLLVEPGLREWLAYFRRTLPDAPIQDRIDRYERHMKFGPARDYWTEFVFEAYVNHRSDVIFLAGLPDVPSSRPHSRVNS